jgi:predicted nucleic acid-binding protein
MSPILVLDAEAMSSFARQRGPRFREVHAAIQAALRLRRDVVTPAVILAELYRGRGHNQAVDASLSRETWIQVRDTDRQFARYVGGILAAAGADSSHLADAHAVAAAVEAGGGTILTGDEDDLNRLVASYPSIHVTGI